MQVLSWQHKRHRLVLALAKLDTQIASRADALEHTWVEKYRLSPHESGQAPPPAADTGGAPANPAAASPAPAAAPTTPPEQTVPDYLL